MTQELFLLLISAVSIGFIHTIVGPDHYIPFIVLARARGWSLKKTSVITFLCGLGHVASSILIGMIGIALGIALFKLEYIESFRGSIAGWLLITFGTVYFLYGIRVAKRNKPHSHFHHHGSGSSHDHEHVHVKDHVHVHEERKEKSLTPWILFIIFIFGPCEPLIPLLMYPAFKNHYMDVAIVSLVFGIVTIGAMMGMVILSTLGLSFIPFARMEKYAHSLAGLAILLCGVGIQFLGL